MKESIKEQALSQKKLDFHVNMIKPTFCKLSIRVPSIFVDAIFKQSILSQQRALTACGFHHGNVPIEYIEQNFMHVLVEHVQEFIFKYFVLPYLYEEIRNRKLLLAGEPRLHNIQIAYQQDAFYEFELSLYEPIALQEWRYYPFKAPKRKKYKDLDRQVDNFIKYERSLAKTFDTPDEIHINDWVFFSLEMLDQEQQPVFEFKPLLLWLKMGDEAADAMLRTIFVGHKKDDVFVSEASGLQHIFSQEYDTHYIFKIVILDVLHDTYFCFDLFKKYFKLKANKDMIEKLIEVFSYRNNLSQRRTMVEEALALLLHKHPFSVPKHLVLRQQERVLERVADNPDYHVYKVQKDFQQRIAQLAEKQVKEALLLDQLAYNDNIIPSNLDIKAYLNLTKRQRTKEFIHFDQPITRICGQEAPICAEELRHICMREKTVNHIIYYLTRP